MFCASCGAPLQGAQPNSGAAPAAAAAAPASGMNRNRIIGIAAVAVVAVVAIFLFSSLFGGRSYEKTVDKFFTVLLEGGNMSDVLDLIPDEIVDYATEEMGYTRAELVDELDSMTGNLQSALNSIGMDVDLSYDITGATDITGSELLSLEEQYDAYDVNISGAKTVTVDLTIEVVGFGEQSTSMSVPVIKTGSSWYLDLVSGSIF